MHKVKKVGNHVGGWSHETMRALSVETIIGFLIY